MKVGVNLINFGPSASPDSLRRWARLTEALGYHLLMTSDHVTVTAAV
ncbi:MAG TPA: LLM class F420-dependent oxidoreductase, partial [Acidobacteria bacterium]|nr:LLM class F420-dependent oxidoreductase [Acidobacteriota bacterium]